MRPSESLEASLSSADNVVALQQGRTRDKVFRSVGTAIDLGVDTLTYSTNAAAWTAGRGVRGLIDGVRSLYGGVTKKPFSKSA